MKNTFNAERRKVCGMWPYIVHNIQGKQLYLFEITRKTGFWPIAKIHEAFGFDGNLIFATTDKHVFMSTPSIDASNLYELGERPRYPLYLFSGIFFYDSEVVELTDPAGKPYKRLVPTDRIVDLITIKP